MIRCFRVEVGGMRTAFSVFRLLFADGGRNAIAVRRMGRRRTARLKEPQASLMGKFSGRSLRRARSAECCMMGWHKGSSMAVCHSQNTAVSLARGTAVTAINKYINSTKRVLCPVRAAVARKAIPATLCLRCDFRKALFATLARSTWPAAPYLRPNLRSTPTPSTPLRRL